MLNSGSACKDSIGLKSDGTVLAVGNNKSGQCEVSEWRDIVAISAGNTHTVGLKADGTVVAVGNNICDECEVSGWSDIVAVSACSHTVGLKADGTVVATGHNWIGECEVSEWRDIVAISAGQDYTVGLKADGTVVAVGNNDSEQCEVSAWKWYTNILAKRWLHYISTHTKCESGYGKSLSIFWDEMTVLGYTKQLPEHEKERLFYKPQYWHDLVEFKKILEGITDIDLMVFIIYYKWRTCRQEILSPKYRDFFLCGFERLAQITECNTFKEDTRGW